MPKKTPLQEAFDIDNLRRAWRWLRTNPDARYKRYFRDLYSSYAVIDEWFLNDLSDRLQRGIYQPSHACKVYLPKSSGILRPYTLLTIEDQVVYQAIINIIAEKLFPHIRNKYYTEVFGNIYAGKTSMWFYKKWSDGYKKFNDAARDAVNKGLKFSASFDLTACYDSLDHRVLTSFLMDMRFNQEFCEFLKSLLRQWSATDQRKRIYIDHGIPQGPMSSGLLSEVILQYFDHRHRHKNMRYLRYVDDIRLFAASPTELRRSLVSLDLLSKDIGLFPQSSKIEIHEVKDIEGELKSISNPVESSVRKNLVDQKKLCRRLIELSPRFKISNPTKFKYLLAHALPSFLISARLWRIYEKDPSFYESMMRYFQRYRIFSKTVADRFLKEIKTPQVYNTIQAAIIETAEGRFPHDKAREFHRAVRALWKYQANTLPIELQYSVGRWLIRYDLLKSFQQRLHALSAIKNWYSRVNTTRALDNNTLILQSQTRLLNNQLKDKSDDVAITAAFLIAKRNIPVLLQVSAINHKAHAFLKEMGLILKSPSRLCGIEKNMTRLIGPSVAGLNWKNIFLVNYKRAEQLAISCRAHAETNVTSWVNVMDSFNDLLLNELYAHDSSLGRYKVGKIGAYLGSTSPFSRNYPKMYKMIKEFHDKRLESELSHPFIRNSGRPTGIIKYSFMSYGKGLIREAFTELFSKW
jgi:hypothetical protein